MGGSSSYLPDYRSLPVCFVRWVRIKAGNSLPMPLDELVLLPGLQS